MTDAHCTEPKNLSDVIWINQTPVGKRIEISRFFHDHADAAAVSAIAKAVLGRPTNGRVYFNTRGTYVTLEPNPPVLKDAGRGELAELTSIIQPLNTWMAARAEIIKHSGDAESALNGSGAELAAWQFPTLFQTLARVAGSDGRCLLVGGSSGAGGTLVIPPRPLLKPARKITATKPEGAERVRGTQPTFKIITPAGTAYQVDRPNVADGVAAGGSARILHPQKARSGKVASRIRHVHTLKDDKK